MNTEKVQYALNLITGECLELLAEIGNASRFGIDTPNETEQRNLILLEIGDVLAAFDYYFLRCCTPGDYVTVETFRNVKFAKLINPDSKDKLGRRLAP